MDSTLFKGKQLSGSTIEWTTCNANPSAFTSIKAKKHGFVSISVDASIEQATEYLDVK